MRRKVVIIVSVLCCLGAAAQQDYSALDSLYYNVEMQATLSKGDNTPLWLNANRYGISSLDKSNGYLRAAAMRPLSVDADRRWGLGYGLDVAVVNGFTSRMIFQ